MRAWILGGLLTLAACSEKLEGSTWKGKFEKDTVTFWSTAATTVKATWSRDWNGPPQSTTSEMTYAVDGKTVLMKTGDKVTVRGQLENGDMVGVPVDFGFEDLDSKARIVVKKQK